MLRITTDSKLMLAEIQAENVDEIDLVDGYLASDLVVVDSGRILVPLIALDSFVALAHERGLDFEIGP